MDRQPSSTAGDVDPKRFAGALFLATEDNRPVWRTLAPHLLHSRHDCCRHTGCRGHQGRSVRKGADLSAASDSRPGVATGRQSLIACDTAEGHVPALSFVHSILSRRAVTPAVDGGLGDPRTCPSCGRFVSVSDTGRGPSGLVERGCFVTERRARLRRSHERGRPGQTVAAARPAASRRATALAVPGGVYPSDAAAD
jgi:hypothetical protein